MANPLTLTLPVGLPFIDTSRDVDLPIDKVFGAYADPELFARWMGPRDLKTVVDEYDFRSGGSYRFRNIDPDGNEYSFRGTFHTVRTNELIIQTFEFLTIPDVVAIESLTFESLGDGRTRLEGHSVFPTVEARDGMAGSDMETGIQEGYEKLEELLRD
ncbi:MAG: SRPBCC family protein [Brooklawnia sp.]|jgi:uncharacterized protein YndB with AHSA1/START domain